MASGTRVTKGWVENGPNLEPDPVFNYGSRPRPGSRMEPDIVFQFCSSRYSSDPVPDPVSTTHLVLERREKGL